MENNFQVIDRVSTRFPSPSGRLRKMWRERQLEEGRGKNKHSPLSPQPDIFILSPSERLDTLWK